MWLSKPLYEALPYYYVVLGLVALAAPLYVDYWYWPTICTVIGFVSLAAGAFVWVRRRDHRSRAS
jgi:Flp pilus assembly protein TadB